MQGLSWYWIALEVAVPPPVALLVAYLFWRKGQMILGNVVGTGVLFGSAFALIPAQNATGNWIKVVQRVPVRIQLNPQELAQHPLRVGLSMTAKIKLS